MYLENKKISVVGGGLVGSLLATYLRKQGANILVFDKRSDPRKDINQAGRSINLALSDRGIRALKTLGIKSQIMKIAMPMYKRIMHSNSGSLTEQKYGKSNQAIYSVSRHILNTKLIDIAEQHNVEFNFNKECREIDFANNTNAGLDAYVFTTNLSKALQSAKQINAGSICINEPHYSVQLPHGGLKQSGVGKDCSRYSIEEYLTLKRVSILMEN